MKGNSNGTVEFSFKLDKNPKAFKDNEIFIFSRPKFDDDQLKIFSEGKTLCVTLIKDNGEEFSLFKTGVIPFKNEYNIILVYWDNFKMSLSMNNQILQTIDFSEFYN